MGFVVEGEGIVEDATRSFRDYFYVLTVASLPVAIMVWVAALVMSVPLAFTIALVTFVTSYVPYIGALISSVFALLIAFGSGGIVPALVMLIVILVAQNVVQPVVQRQMERSSLDLHPIAGFGSTIIGSVLFGILGATLSAPAARASLVCATVASTSAVSVFVIVCTETGAPPPMTACRTTINFISVSKFPSSSVS